MKHLDVDSENDALNVLVAAVRNDERKDRARAVADRLTAIACCIRRQELNGVESAELIRREAERYRDESQELH
ncbi:DUF2732 family protein [Candidatus Pantoea deserta]|uniref:DUF2732 family protein n=1 Tax=Candidatus Pantoea deserta TaxID=1869313 RepID=A0A3N4P663_9GAMM|nr:DUF2732 family protein [Pantoea deserta]RPD99189.1 DUF2732 family protein [Pantoea deserta]